MPLTTASRIHSLIIDQLGVTPGQLTPSATIMEDLGADSLDIVELALAIEDEFDMEISDDEIEELLTVGEVVEYVEGRLEKAQQQVVGEEGEEAE